MKTESPLSHNANQQLPQSKWAVFVVLAPALLAVFSLGLGREHNRAAAADPSWYPHRHSLRWDCIVIHHSGCEIGGATRFNVWHRARGWDELGYHFVIGNGSDTPDGRVEVGPRWIEQKHGAHCKTPSEFYNEHGIGICLVGNFDNHPPTAAQTRSLVRLVRFLCREYHIPASHIYTHGGITGKTDCPGADFDLHALRKAAAR